MFEELLISVLFIIVLIILCIISNLYSKKEKETIKNSDTDWMNIFKKKEKTLLLSVRLGAKAQYGGCVQWMLWVGGYRLGSSECI